MRDINKTGALFDLDGVIIDSESLYTEFWTEIENIYPTGIDNFPVAIKGTTLPTILENYPIREIRDDVTRRLVDFQANMKYRLFPGAIEFLEEIRSKGIPTALITSSDNQKMNCVFNQLPRLKDKFGFIIDGSMVKNSKPHPEGYLRGAEAIGRNPEDCFVFEDSLQGLAAGRASGATVIGVATTYPVETVSQIADKTITGFTPATLDEILDL